MTVNDLADTLDTDAGFKDYTTAVVPSMTALGVGAIAAMVGYHLND